MCFEGMRQDCTPGTYSDGKGRFCFGIALQFHTLKSVLHFTAQEIGETSSTVLVSIRLAFADYSCKNHQLSEHF